jgi:putative Holliday junction resolvase
MLTDTNKRVLAIDYGSKRIGLAISDPLRLFPSINITIENSHKKISELMKIISEKNIDTIVLGYPGNNGKSNLELANKILSFKIELEHISKIRVSLWDEQFTSKMAESRIVNSVVKRSQRRDKSLIDAHSAAIILEEYLRNSK